MSAPSDDPYRIAYERCPICGHDGFGPLHEQTWTWRADYRPALGPTIRWMECHRCAHQFTAGYFNDEGLRELFHHTQPRQSASGYDGAAVEAARPVWQQVVDAVTPLQPAGRWLDVGAGDGMLLALARECGFDVVASDMRDTTADALHAIGIPTVAASDDLAAVESSSVDVVSFCDVLEHMPFPLVGIAAGHRVLRPGGVLFASCPNRASLAWEVLNQEGANPFWAEIEHHHNFSFGHLRTLLQEHGFHEIRCSVSNRYRICMDVVARRG